MTSMLTSPDAFPNFHFVFSCLNGRIGSVCVAAPARFYRHSGYRKDGEALGSAGPNPLLANEYAFGANANASSSSRWVTVYGFQQSDRDLILRELQECGEVISCRSGGTERNFMHIQFASKGEAQKALGKNGKQVSTNLMIGIAPISSQHASTLQSGAGGLGGDVPGFARPQQQHLVMPDAMPQPVNTFWSKVNEYIFGF